MKLGLIVVVLLLVFSTVTAATIDTKEEYKTGETIIAKISARFTSELESSNIAFYRGHVKVPFDVELTKLQDYYYLKASTVLKSPNNYTIKIVDESYYEGITIIEETIETNVTLTTESAAFDIDPGARATNNDFSLNLQNLLEQTITVEIETPEELDAVSEVILDPGQAASVDVSLGFLQNTLLTSLNLTYEDTTYTVPVYLYVTQNATLCGNDKIDAGEACDNENWGDITSCEDFGFSFGELSCISPGNLHECTFNTSLCYNDEDEEAICGNDKIESGEQCDTDTFGNVNECEDLGYGGGDLLCDDDCSFDTSDCYDKEDECERNSDCDDGYYCDSDDECAKKECDYKDRECDDDEECDDYECVSKDKECQRKADCKDKEICEDNECKRVECTRNSHCADDEVCDNNRCVNEVSQKTCSDLGGKFCLSDQACSGESENVNNDVCCIGNCVDKPASSTRTYIGWILISLIVVGVIFFYLKFKRTKRKIPDFSKRT